MTRPTNARIAGTTFLLYFAAVMAPAAGLGEPHVRVLLTLVGPFSAIVLGVTLYGLTREQDPDIATLGLVCRVAEGVLGATLLPVTLAVTGGGSIAVSGGESNSLLASVRSWNTVVSALFFAVGSTAFTWLLLRARMIPASLAWLGVGASALMVVALPLKMAGLPGPVLEATSLPIVFFELPLGVLLIVKGVASPAAQARTPEQV